MHCRNCGKEVHPQAVVCTACGVPPLTEKNYCQNCGTPTQPNQTICTSCGVALTQKTASSGSKSKVAAGLLGIFLGSLGIHKFYLGYGKEGVIMLLISLLSFGFLAAIVGIVGLIEGIIYITKSDDEFDQTYVQARKGWF